ncbi:MAG: TGS domain-containing protein [Trichodesmium sp. MAG_R03]|nr:TGS domain-containing protein [Trichodesmium sp. MAG_R03]
MKNDYEGELEDVEVYTKVLERLNSVFGECTFLEKTPEIQKRYVVKKIHTLTNDTNLSFTGLLCLLLSNYEIENKDSKKQEYYSLDLGIMSLDYETKKRLRLLKKISNILSLFSLKNKLIKKIDEILIQSNQDFLNDDDLDQVINWDELTDVENIIMMIFVTMSEEQDILVLIIELVCRLSFLKYIKLCKYWQNQHIENDLKILHDKTISKKSTLKIYVALETFSIFVPIANRLGIWSIKWELEDFSFRELQPDIYSKIATLLNQKRQEREDYLEYYLNKLKAVIIEDRNIKDDQFLVSGRPKNIYSTYAKMKQLYSYENNVSNSRTSFNKLKSILKQDSNSFQKIFEGVYDLFGVRVICDSKETCYQILGIIRGNFKKKSTLLRKYGELADYIERPKSNGYQSIHLVIHAPKRNPAEDDRKLEVQIRTKDMHKEAEDGVAAHWKYKEKSNLNTTDQYVFNILKRYIHKKGVYNDTMFLIFVWNWYKYQIKDLVDKKYLDSLSNWVQGNKEEYPQNENDNDNDKGIKYLFYWLTSLVNCIHSKQIELSSKIYVFTPEKKIIPLKKDSTPIDFAYRIHTKIGDHCAGALVNGKIVPLSTPLQNGDIVDIITQKSSHPSWDWLTFVKTNLTKNRIKGWHRQSDKKEYIARGRELLEKELGLTLWKNLKLDAMQIVAQKCNYQNEEDLYAALGYGGKMTSFNQVVNLIKEQLKEKIKENGRNILEGILVSNNIKLQQQSDDLLELAQQFNFYTTDDFLASLGGYNNKELTEPQIDRNQVIVKLQEISKSKVYSTEIITRQQEKHQKTTVENNNYIRGIEGIKYHVAGCCSPIPGEKSLVLLHKVLASRYIIKNVKMFNIYYQVNGV